MGGGSLVLLTDYSATGARAAGPCTESSDQTTKTGLVPDQKTKTGSAPREHAPQASANCARAGATNRSRSGTPAALYSPFTIALHPRWEVSRLAIVLTQQGNRNDSTLSHNTREPHGFQGGAIGCGGGRQDGGTTFRTCCDEAKIETHLQSASPSL